MAGKLTFNEEAQATKTGNGIYVNVYGQNWRGTLFNKKDGLKPGQQIKVTIEVVKA